MPGMSVRIESESVAGFNRNGCPDETGIRNVGEMLSPASQASAESLKMIKSALNKTKRFYKAKPGCDWSKRYSLCSEEGPGLIGNATDVTAPEGALTIADVAEACKQKDPIMKTRTCILEACLRHCPAATGVGQSSRAASVHTQPA